MPKIKRDHQTVLKFGPDVRREEGNALILAASLGVPVPRVHDISTSEDGSCTIRMDYVDGICLEDAWENMHDEDKKSIAQQLRRILAMMRSAQPSSSTPHIGACDGPARDIRHITDYDGGPFQSEGDFNTFVLLRVAKGAPHIINKILEEALRTLPEHRIVFSHADLSPRNIIIRNSQIIALLDWEYAGWYPEYWEYVKFLMNPSGCKGWHDLASDIFEISYPSEFVAHQAVARFQRV